MAWRWVGTRDAAEDVAQDVCVKVATALAGFRAEAEFASWLQRVTYNAAIDHIRDRERQRKAQMPEGDGERDGMRGSRRLRPLSAAPRCRTRPGAR